MVRRFLMLLLLCLVQRASAKTLSSRSYAQISEDGRRLLVMTTGKPSREYGEPKPFKLPDGRDVILEAAFQKSGVYELATLAPVWQVDWYCYQKNLAVSPDLDSLVRVNDHALTEGTGPGLEFFNKGLSVKRYRSNELLKTLRAPFFFILTSTNWHLDWYSNFAAQDGKLIFKTAPRLLGAADYRLNLGMQDSWVFDLRTGEVLASKTLGKARFVGFLLAAGALLVMPWLIWLLRRTRRGKNPGRADAG
jgi:hypothetical protein